MQRLIPSLCETGEPRLIFVQHRKSLSRTTHNTFPLIHGVQLSHYQDKDIKGEIDIDDLSGLIIQVESLARISDESLKRYGKETILILDEFASIVKQMESGMGHCARTSAVFNYLMQEADLVVAMDGYFDQARLDILEKYGKESALLIINTFKSRAEHKVEFSQSARHTLEWQLDQMEKGKRCMCPCSEKTQAERIVEAIKERFGDSKVVILYTSEQQWDGLDINAAWAKADCVIFTATIDCGVSCELVNHFDYVVAYATQTGPTFEAFTQMLSSARDVKDFVIACPSYNAGNVKSFKLQDIIDDRFVAIQDCDAAFFGTNHLAMTNSLSTTWKSCTPSAATYVMGIALDLRTKADMPGELYKNLTRNGAKLLTWEKFDTGAQLKKRKRADGGEEDCKIQKTISTADLLAIEVHYKFKFAVHMSDDGDALMKYVKPQLKAAFHNLNTLALHTTRHCRARRARWRRCRCCTCRQCRVRIRLVAS
jgi:hypothetical protein